MLTPLPTLTNPKKLQTLSRRTWLVGAYGLVASLPVNHAAQDRSSTAGDETCSWHLCINSKFLPVSVVDLIAKLKNNPAGFSFNYGLVEGEVGQAEKMDQFKREYALQLEQVHFKTWQDAHSAFTKAQVDLIFAPTHLTKMFAA
jgi:hypothetical protein